MNIVTTSSGKVMRVTYEFELTQEDADTINDFTSSDALEHYANDMVYGYISGGGLWPYEIEVEDDR